MSAAVEMCDDNGATGTSTIAAPIKDKRKSSTTESFSGSYNAVDVTRENERNNLIVMTRLVIRGLLQASMESKNRMLSPTQPELVDLLVMIEKVLMHGFRAYKTVLQLRTPEQELWIMIEKLGKLVPALKESVTCVQQLPNVSTPICVVRAWLRLAVMQKRLAEYVQALVDCTQLLNEYYFDWALLRDDTLGTVLYGSLIGIRVFDCNLWLKEEDLNRQPLNINMCNYVKIPTVGGNEEQDSNEAADTERKELLDQNNYLEERNQQLSANIANLERRIELMESLRTMGNVEVEETQNGEVVVKPMVSKVDELCTAMELMERSVHEKQDAIVDLHTQMSDVKKINVELYAKLRHAEERIKQREKLLKDTEKQYDRDRLAWKGKADEMNVKIKNLTEKVKELEKNCDTISSEQRTKTTEAKRMSNELNDLKSRNEQLQQSLSEERKARQSADTELNALRNIQAEYKELKERCSRYELLINQQEQSIKDYERTLEEMGGHMAQSKLKLEDLREELLPLTEAQWEDDKTAVACKQCQLKFSATRRKHHCRNCGGIFCASCSENTMPLPSSAKLVRVCDNCYALLLNRFSAKPETSS